MDRRTNYLSILPVAEMDLFGEGPDLTPFSASLVNETQDIPARLILGGTRGVEIQASWVPAFITFLSSRLEVSPQC